MIMDPLDILAALDFLFDLMLLDKNEIDLMNRNVDLLAYDFNEVTSSLI